MIRTIYYPSGGSIEDDFDPSALTQALQDPNGLLWVDFQGTPPEEDEPVLIDIFHFHPLAVDDALKEVHVPRLDDWGQYLFIVLHTPVFGKDRSRFQTIELDIFLGTNYIITHHDQPLEPVDRLWESVHIDHRHLERGSDYLLYRLTDEVVAGYLPFVDEIDDEIDRIEDMIFRRPDPHILERIFKIKRAVLHLRRIIAPQREVLNRLARDDFQAIDSQTQVYFRDVYDHLVRLYDLADNLRDLVSGILDTYLSVINNRMNEIMKTLTIITTIFMPVSFVVSFFGMNFFIPARPLEAWVTRPAFWLTLLLLVMVPFSMLIWIRRRGWM